MVGEQDINPNNLTATFYVPYKPGTIKAETVREKGRKSQPAFLIRKFARTLFYSSLMVYTEFLV